MAAYRLAVWAADRNSEARSTLWVNVPAFGVKLIINNKLLVGCHVPECDASKSGRVSIDGGRYAVDCISFIVVQQMHQTVSCAHLSGGVKGVHYEKS